MPPKTRSAAPRSKPRVRYQEDSDVDINIDPDAQPSRQIASRPRRSVRYRDESESDHESESEPELELPVRAAQASATASPAKRSSTTRKQSIKSTKRKASARTIGQPKKARTANKEPENAINFRLRPGAEHPSWATLPYEILFSIFQSAAYPLIDEHWNRRETVPWLINSARVCKTFLEPALATLYHGPPIVHLYQYQAFLRLVEKEGTIINYRSKVHQLDFEYNLSRFISVSETLAGLIRKLPALKALGIHDTLDHPQPMNRLTRAPLSRAELMYRQDWIDSLATVTLTRFKFHCLGIGHSDDVMFETWALQNGELHPAFRHLERLEIATLDYARRPNDNPAVFQELPDLKHLTFTRCDFLYLLEPQNPRSGVSVFILDQLPANLRSLEFVSCPQMESGDLQVALRRCCNLQSLVLRSNKSINLDFLTSLGETCPGLQVLVYDLSLYSSFLSTSDTQPYFERLLAPGDVPSWPNKLRKLELNQLRKWDGQTAEAFFKSLLSSAAALADLRKLWITASVGSSWRERIKLREQVITPLIDTFSTGPGTTGPAQSSRRTASPRLGSRARNKDSPVHGNCAEVHIRIDNLRPVEDQKTEGDFLDSEQSGDDNYVD